MAFKEYMIKKERTAADILISFGCYFAAVLIGLAVMIFMLPYNLGGVAMLLFAGAIYGAHIISSRRRKEFEYIMTEDNIDIDVVMNKERRKRLISFSMKETEIIAPMDSTEFADRKNDSFAKTVNALSGRKEADTYFAVVEKKGERILVLFEPTYNMLTSLGQYARSKIHVKD